MYNNSIMEEEIDIEEHDVLDNPRIKDMFPDLTKVKTEVMEDEDLVEPLDEDYIHANDYLQYENDYEYEEYNYYNDLDEDTEIENYTNIIILGSKPSTKEIEEETVKKEYLPAVVMLEDWGDRLKSSSCYCKDCKILFATDNALDYHKMAAHSFLVAITNKAIKSTARSSTSHTIEDIDKNNDATLIPEMTDGNVIVEKNKLCNHCNKYFPDGNTLIKHLYELLTKGDVNSETKKSTKVTNFKYQCTICQKLFLSYQGGKSHMSILHPKVRANSHIIKITGDSKNTSQDVTRPTRGIMKIRTSIDSENNMNYWYSTRMFIKNPPIPKSVLYKCLNCSIHFVMALPAVHHNRYCSENTQFLRCDICKRKMRCHDILLHKLQHKISNDFKIYQGSSRNYKKTLCKCPKCEVCYSETKFWLHYKGCSGEKLNCECCMTCGEFIHSHIATMHMNLHNMDRSVKNDFIIINFAKAVHVHPEENSETIVTTKQRMLHSDNVMPLKKTKRATNKYIKKKRTFHLFYCKTCNSCMHINRWQHHLSNNCRKTANVMCQQCGLMFTQKSLKKHKPLHDHHNVTVHDFEFFLRDGTRTTPRAPHFYQCSKCKVFFATKFHTKHHDCSEKYEICHVCSKKYNPHAFKLHMPFHKYDKTPKHIHPVITNKAELVKSYSSLNKMWNILFLCESCGLNTDSYDEAVGHSQSHLQGSTDTADQALCKVCDLKFNLRCYKNHMQLHKRLPVNKKDFLILPYRYRALFKNQWFNLFGKLASKRVQQIISQSIYRDTRRVNMTLVKNGQTEYTMYVCKLCNVCVKGQDVNKHVRFPCPRVVNDLHCLYCDILFDTAENYTRHETIHKKLDIEFRIVKFDPIASVKQSSESHTKVSSVGKGKFFIFYKCTYCKLSLLCKGAQVNMHVCYDGVQDTCKLCGLRYRPKYVRNHMRLHTKYPLLSRKTVKCHEFRPENGKILHGLSEESIQNQKTTLEHKNVSNVRRKGIDGNKRLTSKIYLVPCKTCGFVFKSRRELSAHLRECNGPKADGRPDEGDFTVYKCSKCTCHFLYWKSLKKHKLTCSSPSRPLHECHVCGLNFSLRSLNTHVPRHHAGHKYTLKVLEPDSGETLVYTDRS